MGSKHGPFDSLAVANRMLDMADAKQMPLTIMQLLKLVYIAHGWHLTLFESRLTEDNPEAWQYGPVYRRVYNAFRGSGIRIVDFRGKDPETGIICSAEIFDREKELLETVTTSYGKWHGFQLSQKTHEPGTPWDKTVKELGYYAEISPVLIKEHFDDLKKQRADEQRADEQRV